MLCFILGNSCSLGSPVVLFALVLNIILNSSHTLAYKPNALWGVNKNVNSNIRQEHSYVWAKKICKHAQIFSRSLTCLERVSWFHSRYRCVEYALNMFGARLMHASVRYMYMCVPILQDIASVTCPKRV